MKKIPRANELNQRAGWVIDPYWLKEVVDKCRKQYKLYVQMETVEEMVMTLSEMGYVELEDKDDTRSSN